MLFTWNASVDSGKLDGEDLTHLLLSAAVRSYCDEVTPQRWSMLSCQSEYRPSVQFKYRDHPNSKLRHSNFHDDSLLTDASCQGVEQECNCFLHGRGHWLQRWQSYWHHGEGVHDSAIPSCAPYSLNDQSPSNLAFHLTWEDDSRSEHDYSSLNSSIHMEDSKDADFTQHLSWTCLEYLPHQSLACFHALCWVESDFGRYILAT